MEYVLEIEPDPVVVKLGPADRRHVLVNPILHFAPHSLELGNRSRNGLASLRRSVRRLLAKYGYPPDLSEDATQLVLKQAERSTEAEIAVAE
ncbi:MAG TPA: type I restriction enzyme endonuclease domain-containing protein [Opitutales bacterium]|nr:type I restriction enzyme endonuclease domain-containing protein [Opitutales bacterium]